MPYYRYLIHQVVKQSAVLDSGGVVQGGLDRHPLIVHDNGPNHTLNTIGTTIDPRCVPFLQCCYI